MDSIIKNSVALQHSTYAAGAPSAVRCSATANRGLATRARGFEAAAGVRAKDWAQCAHAVTSDPFNLTAPVAPATTHGFATGEPAGPTPPRLPSW